MTIVYTLNLANKSPFVTDEIVFHDRSNLQREEAAPLDKLDRGNLFSWLLDTSSNSKPSSRKILSGKNRNRLFDRSTTLSCWVGRNNSFGNSAIKLCEARNTWKQNYVGNLTSKIGCSVPEGSWYSETCHIRNHICDCETDQSSWDEACCQKHPLWHSRSYCDSSEGESRKFPLV